jgi:polysaccharide pyruvyl transferase WcaK-like protein
MNNLETMELGCVVWGGYARGNTGDEWCLAAALERLRPKFGRSIAVLSLHPEYTRWLFPEVTVVPYVAPRLCRLKVWQRLLRKWKSSRGVPATRNVMPDWEWLPESEWIRCMTGARSLYLAGGGYLTDLFPMEQILPPIELAWHRNLSISTAPIGIGPFRSNEWAERVTSVLERTDLKVRDQHSLDFCRARRLNAALEPDDASLEVRKALPIQILERNTGPPKIGVCIFQQYGKEVTLDMSDWWITCLRGLNLQHPDSEIEGFCFHTSLQAEFGEMVRLFQRAGLPVHQVRAPVWDFRAATAAIQRYDFIIATRFHAIVGANAFGIPNLAVALGDYYLAKMNAAVSGYEQKSRLVNPTNTAPEAMLAFCRSVLDLRSRV